MNWDAIGAIGEVVGAFAVVVSIIYLSGQIRQSNRTAEAGTTFDSSRLIAEWHRGVTQSPDLAAIWFRAMEGGTDLTEEERARFLFTVAEFLILIEALYHQRELGFVSEEAWAPGEKILLNLLANPYISEWWRAEVSWTSESFREYVNKRSPEYSGDTEWGSRMREFVKVGPQSESST